MQTRGAPNARDQLPVHRLLALVVSDLTLAGDPERGAAPVHGLDLEIEAGALVFLTPPARGRTVILHLSGQLTDEQGGAPTTDAAWRCVVVPRSPGQDVTVRQLLDGSGDRATAVGRRLGLDQVLDRPLPALDAGQQILARLAGACADSPDVVALDEPTKGMDPQTTLDVISAIRELVDTDGRTVVVTCDPAGMPEAARRLADRTIEIGSSTPETVLLASKP